MAEMLIRTVNSVHPHALVPTGGAVHGGREDPAAKLGNQPGLLRQRNEFIRHDPAPGGVVPADQCLNALDPPVASSTTGW